jgi:hypothetical protein
VAPSGQNQPQKTRPSSSVTATVSSAGQKCPIASRNPTSVASPSSGSSWKNVLTGYRITS